jgi:RluA family pseudouridine synthase
MNGQKLLSVISEKFTYHSSKYWQEKINEGLIKINGQKTHSDQILSENDEIEFLIPDFEEKDLNLDYKIIWQDDHLLLVSKPADLPVHSTKRFFFQNLTNILRKDLAIEYLHPLHRLDRETSGLMFYAKTHYALKRLQKNLNRYLTAKFYLGIVKGNFTRDQIEVNRPLADCNSEPVPYRVIVSDKGKQSRTIFHKIDSDSNHSLLLIELKTGRKHQIRAHLEHLGFHLIGEKLYAHNAKFFIKRRNDELTLEDQEILGAKHHLLHCYALSTRLPGNDPQTFISNYFPQDFESYLKYFKNWANKSKEIIVKNTLQF